MTRGVSAVLAAIESGATTIDEVAVRCGLSHDLVELAIDQLVRMGRLDARELSHGCPSDGCRTCTSAAEDGSPACGSDRPSAQRSGPVLVAWSVVSRE